MSGDFIDSNVLVYLVDSSEPAKRAIARELVRNALHTGDGLISRDKEMLGPGVPWPAANRGGEQG